jgi:hypothetical protein
VITVWHTYVDWTLEEVSRPFNVGKGNNDRVRDVLARNVVWHRIAKKHGQKREIVFSSSSEIECFEKEQHLILELKTCPYLEGGWGANLCLGGPGPTGARWSDEAKRKLSESITSLWSDPSYRQKLMSRPPDDVRQLEVDGITMTWDDLAAKYCVSATTVKRWFKELQIVKINVPQSRKAWMPEEQDELMRLYESKKSVRSIAAALHRTECSIKKRIQKLCNDRGVIRSRYRKCE